MAKRLQICCSPVSLKKIRFGMAVRECGGAGESDPFANNFPLWIWIAANGQADGYDWDNYIAAVNLAKTGNRAQIQVLLNFTMANRRLWLLSAPPIYHFF